MPSNGLEVAQLIENIKQYSTANAAQEIKNNPVLANIVSISNQLCAAYQDYEAFTEEYSKVVSAYAKAKRDVKNATGSGNLIASLSATLAQAKKNRDAKRKEADFLKKAETKLRAIYDLVHEFQQNISQFLGVQIEMVYVFKSGKTKAVIKLSDLKLGSNLYKFDMNADGKLILRYNTSKINAVIKEMMRDGKELEKLNDQFSDRVEALYGEIERRYNIAKAKKSRLLFWNIGGEWRSTTITAFGDILEAYVNMGVNEKQDPIPNGSYDEQIDWFVSHYLRQVDNASGFLHEDVEIGNSGHYYGVKGDKASVMGLTPIINLAQAVNKIASGGTLDVPIEQLQKGFEASTARGEMTPLAQSDVEKVVKDKMPELLKS